MLNPVMLGGAVMAGASGMGLLWGNIKGIFARFESVFIVRADLHYEAKIDFMDYCWTHFKPSTLGVRKFNSQDSFIRPKNRFGRIMTEITGDFITFWDGWKPIFVSINTNNNSVGSGNTKISFIRGMFNLEKLLIDASHFADQYKHEKTGSSSRYIVKKCFGKKRDNHQNGEPHLPRSIDYKDEDAAGFRPLFYSKDSLGVPTSKTPMDNLAYGKGVQDFYDEVKRWKESKEWFKSKGLAWRFGALLAGLPGTGKSSLARAIGQSLDLPIHNYDLTTMDNEDLVENWQESLTASPCIVLLEDIDRIFDENKQIRTAMDKAPLTLDCLLNCISGVQPSDGILVLVTANDVTKLDPALGVPDVTGKSTRPGRLDRAVYVGILDEEGRYKIANRILSDYKEMIEETVNAGVGETGAQFESRCSALALSHYWGGFKSYGEE